MAFTQFNTPAMLLCLAFAIVSTSCQSLRQIGKISAPHAAFTSIVNKEHATGQSAKSTLIISGFNPIPLFHDTIYQVPEIGQHLSNLHSVHVTEVTRGVTWPNEVRKVPDNVFHKSSFVVAAGGFLVPTKDHGSLTLFDLDFSPPVKHALTDNSADAKWFYHRVEWKDMNGDGLLDAVTCRAQKHIFGSAQGQLVWFEHPKQNALSSTWNSHVIAANGPDSFFIVTSLPTPHGKVDCIITAGYFSTSLNVYWSTQTQGRWDDASKIEKRVIDNTIGNVFDVSVVDLNQDGTLDLLVTNNALKDASLFAYTVPSDFRKDHFPRRTLATGFTSRTSGQGHGAPGSAVVVYPKSSHTASQKPLILVSGDDDGQAYLIKPASNGVSDWSYQQSKFLDVGTGTVGGISCADVDGDGYNEVFVPAYTEGAVHVFTFKP
ncbi:uncharacterized protein [Littorina saxatilis]|uniref:Uncharacterized protein n=1 Tax=Littorina saxatilis TaxID=31220 RepID=A0AAN9AV70_9CAEN